MKRALLLLYGIVAYFVFFATLVYFIGFVGNLTPVTIDSPRRGPLATALLINLALVALFALQHSVMARKPFKRWIGRFIPPEAERSTFVLAATVLLGLMMWQWRPLGGTLWAVSSPLLRIVLYTIYALGWVLLIASTFSIDHFDLFGLRQAWLGFRGKGYTPIQFRNPWLYRQVRHPLYLGFFLGLWATPMMSMSHFALASGLSAHILFGTRLEESDLVSEHPEYKEYQQQVPMYVPGLKGSPESERTAAGDLSL